MPVSVWELPAKCSEGNGSRRFQSAIAGARESQK